MDILKKIKKILYSLQYALISVPIALAITASIKISALYFILAIIFAFVVVAVMPICKHYENAWMFFMTAITVVPINIRVIVHLFSGGANSLIGVLWGVILFFVMLSIEELIAGVITRIIWKNQRSFDDYEQLNS